MKSCVARISILLLAMSLLEFGIPSTQTLFSGPLLPTPVPNLRIYPRMDSPVRGFLQSLIVNAPEQYGGLTLFPITTRAIDPNHYLTLEEALKQHALEVRETGYGEVNEVELKNDSGDYIFAMSGEILEGAKQDRFFQQDMLLPPKTNWISVPVFCTEHGRWTEGENKFSSSSYMVPQAERKTAGTSLNQEEVWRSADKAIQELHVSAPTSNAKNIYQQPNVKREIAPYATKLKDLPFRNPRVVGVAASREGHLIVIDVFQNSEIFRKLYPKLLQSYVTDVLDNPEEEKEDERNDHILTPNNIRTYLEDAGYGVVEPIKISGAGQAFRIKGNRVTGTALTFSINVIHLDLFPGTSAAVPKPVPLPRMNLQYRRKEHG